jgi:ABC-type multidrug transport system fused ATPase/permease subunit
MILTDPEVIIFDEATSQLDSESERLIQEAFWKAARNKTTIIIAHRLSTVVKADKIVVIENGRVVEEGSHRALVNKKGGWYRKYWRLQVGG